MAEELDIRSLWNKGKAQENPDSLNINMLEKKGTKTTLYWVKFILWIEFALNLVTAGPLMYFLLDRGDPKWFITVYFLIVLLYSFYYLFLIKQIRSFSYDGNVVQSLKKVYGYLRFYVLHYKVVLWVSLLIGVISGIFQAGNESQLNQFNTTKEWLIFGGVLAIMVLIAGSIFHLLIHLIYGRKIKRLKKMVKDLEREE